MFVVIIAHVSSGSDSVHFHGVPSQSSWAHACETLGRADASLPDLLVLSVPPSAEKRPPTECVRPLLPFSTLNCETTLSKLRLGGPNGGLDPSLYGRGIY